MQFQAMHSLLIITLTASIVPIITSHVRGIRFPVVVGEIIAGLILGTSGFNLIETSPLLNFLSAFGFTYLMFLAGLEIDINILQMSLKSRSEGWRNPIFLAFGTFSLTIILSFVIAMGLTKMHFIKNPWFVCLVLSTTSLGIVVPVLKEKGIINSRYGQAILVSALIADFLTMLLITVVVLILTNGEFYKLFLIILLFITSYLFYRLLKLLSGLPVINSLTHATSQIKVRGCLALIFVLVTLSEYLGVESILGAFMAGAIVSFAIKTKEQRFILKLESMGYGFFIPIFFIMVGAGFNLPEAAKTGGFKVLLPVFIAALYLVKILPALLFRLSFSWRQSFSAGFLLSSRLSLIIAAAALGVKLGAMSQNTYGTIIISAVITCLASPLIFEKLTSHRNKAQSTE